MTAFPKPTRQERDLARKKLRTLVYCEGLALATLESVRAAVELTTGGRAR